MYFWFVETDDGQQYLNINKHDKQTSRTKYDQTIKYIMKTLFDNFLIAIDVNHHNLLKKVISYYRYMIG